MQQQQHRVANHIAHRHTRKTHNEQAHINTQNCKVLTKSKCKEKEQEFRGLITGWRDGTDNSDAALAVGRAQAPNTPGALRRERKQLGKRISLAREREHAFGITVSRETERENRQLVAEQQKYPDRM